ncbi:MAG: hypothetical protein Tsb0020_19100 [Haliangiales bacterium]
MRTQTRRCDFAPGTPYRDRDHVDTGLVWYDVNTSDTGPDELPTIVRNKTRLEVHRKLTGNGSAARALVDIHG